MKNYKYFENVEKNAYFTDVCCQFCGSDSYCLEGVFFERDDVSSVCLECFDKRMVSVDVPDYIKTRVKSCSNQKITDLQYTPPVPWIQNNDWPVCCDDFMVYIGEWQQTDFDNYSENKPNNGIEVLKLLLAPEIAQQVENYENLWQELGCEAGAFAFRCPCCGKTTVICQEY